MIQTKVNEHERCSIEARSELTDKRNILTKMRDNNLILWLVMTMKMILLGKGGKPPHLTGGKS